MKASYILALFAVFAVSANAWEHGIKDSKVQSQSADNAGADISDNSGNLVGANNLAKGGVNILADKKQTVQNNQQQRQ